MAPNSVIFEFSDPALRLFRPETKERSISRWSLRHNRCYRQPSLPSCNREAFYSRRQARYRFLPPLPNRPYKERLHRQRQCNFVLETRDILRAGLAKYLGNGFNFGTHSLRAGAASHAANFSNVPDSALDKHVGWKSAKSKFRYIKDSEAASMLVSRNLGL